MTTYILLPPSEWKNNWWSLSQEKTSFWFIKPLDIALQATPKDLKCKDKRYEEAINLNSHISQWPFCPAIQRYSGTLYKELWYDSLTTQAQQYIDSHVLIFSGMYGLLRPDDSIANYKLPIETWWSSWLDLYRKETITQTLISLKADRFINLLPLSYQKMIDRKQIKTPVTTITFSHTKDGEKKKLTHNTKKYRWQRLRQWSLDPDEEKIWDDVEEIHI